MNNNTTEKQTNRETDGTHPGNSIKVALLQHPAFSVCEILCEYHNKVQVHCSVHILSMDIFILNKELGLARDVRILFSNFSLIYEKSMTLRGFASIQNLSNS